MMQKLIKYNFDSILRYSSKRKSMILKSSKYYYNAYYFNILFVFSKNILQYP